VTTPSDPRHQRAAEDSEPPAGGDEGGDTTADPAGLYGSGPGSTATAARTATAPPVRRPVEAWIGAVFLILAALPAGICGVLLGLQPGNIAPNLRARIDAAHSTVNTDFLLTVFRAVGVTILVLALLYILFAVLAIQPKRGARSVVTALAALEVVLLVAGMVVVGLDPVSLGIVLLAVAGTVLLYLPRSQEFITSR